MAVARKIHGGVADMKGGESFRGVGSVLKEGGAGESVLGIGRERGGKVRSEGGTRRSLARKIPF